MGTVNCRLNCGGIGLIRSPWTPGTEKCPELRCPNNSYGIVDKKVLSVTMPWAWLIMKYGKNVENRTWRTNYRGQILIHASKKPDSHMGEILMNYLGPIRDDVYESYMENCGCILGSIELIDCVQNYKSEWAEYGMWHWVLRNPVLFKKPIPATGHLGIWEYKEYGKK